MTERKPPKISFASWIDEQINEAAEAAPSITCPVGQAAAREGSGRRWPGLAAGRLRREGVSAEELLPTPLRLRKEVERLTATVQDLRSEQDVREVVAGLNQRIVQWRRIPEGPPVYLPLVDADTMVARWRDTRPRPSSPVQVGTPVRDVPSPRPRWWHRLSRRRVPPSVSQ